MYLFSFFWVDNTNTPVDFFAMHNWQQATSICLITSEIDHFGDWASGEISLNVLVTYYPADISHSLVVGSITDSPLLSFFAKRPQGASAILGILPVLGARKG